VGLFASLFRPSSTRPTAPEPVLALDGVIDEDDVARLSVEIRLDAKGEIPAVVPLLSPDAKGMVRTLKGDLLFDEAAQKSVLAKAADWGNDYCFDYGHAMLSPAPGSRPADNEEAAGWYRLAIDGTNLVTQGLSWIPDAADRLKARKIRYVSPAVRFDQKTRRVTEFINAALTNLPATKGMRPLVASRTNEPAPQETSMLKSLLSLLGLSSAATEDDALAQIASLAAFKKELVALSGKASAEEILSEARGWKTASAEVQELKKEVFALSGKTTPAEVLEDVKREHLGPVLEKLLRALDACLDEALSRAGLKDGDVTSVERIGGSSRIPAIGDRLGARFGREKVRGAGSLTAVAVGLGELARRRFLS